MKVAYVTTYDASDVHGWSGLGYNIAKTLEKQDNELDYISLQNMRYSLTQRLKIKFYDKIIGKVLDVERDPIVSKQYAKQIKNKLKPGTDFIFSPATIPTAFLETKTPKIFYTDATFAGLINFYDDFSNLSQETIQFGNLLDRQALETAKLAIYSSDWAAKTAIDFYGADPAKVKVVPFGANVQNNKSFNDIKSIIANRSTTECHLLFIGVDWKRKGGDLALGVASALNKMGLKTTLHIIGIKNMPVKLPDFAIDYGYISKASPEGNQLMEQLFIKSHFLIVPSVAEAYGLVFCEANSFGLPALARNVGGIPTIVKNNVNGMLFNIKDGAQLYADYIHTVFTNRELYKELAQSSFNEYSGRLNWEVSGKKITQLLKDI